MKYRKLMILGSGELGREVVISAKRLGLHIIAVDNYPNAPAMQLADQYEVINMLDSDELERIINKHTPDLVIPEVESIRTEKLIELEKKGLEVIPNARATYLTMDRVAIRELASKELSLRTAKYAYATTLEELNHQALSNIGLPCVIKPVMSSSGKGQSVAHTKEDIKKSWEFACQGMRGDKAQVIIEEFIKFDSEITLLTIRQRNGETLFVEPIGHRQESGDYRESWIPAQICEKQILLAQEMAKKVTDALGGFGIFGVEFFLTKNEVIFNELSPRPHDTGMVTLISQDLSEFDLHVRAILGLPIPSVQSYSPFSASVVILADRESKNFHYEGIADALLEGGTEVRIFNKLATRKNRRMGVALAKGNSKEQAITKAKKAAQSIRILYE